MPDEQNSPLHIGASQNQGNSSSGSKAGADDTIEETRIPDFPEEKPGLVINSNKPQENKQFPATANNKPNLGANFTGAKPASTNNKDATNNDPIVKPAAPASFESAKKEPSPIPPAKPEPKVNKPVEANPAKAPSSVNNSNTNSSSSPIVKPAAVTTGTAASGASLNKLKSSSSDSLDLEEFRRFLEEHAENHNQKIADYKNQLNEYQKKIDELERTIQEEKEKFAQSINGMENILTEVKRDNVGKE
jgi:hypothetical protein